MKCKHAVGLFDSYLNGTANPEEQAALENHIATCEACRQQFELYRFYFADAKVENDFAVPSQLNAKIKYAVYQQADNHKKVPFWQNKRIISAATACAFLFVVGIIGTSHLGKIKEAAKNPNETTATVTEDNGVAMLSTDPEFDSIDEQALDPYAMSIENRAISPRSMEVEESTEILYDTEVENEVHQATIDVDSLEESTVLIPAYPGNLPAIENAHEFGRTLFQKTEPEIPDIVLDIQWAEQILSEFPHEVLSTDSYLVTITKQDLETVIGCSVDVDEEKTQLILQFAEIE